MADSKLPPSDDNSDDELVHCGICFALIDKPKALPCLHTFCQKCLTDWSETSAKKQPEKYTNVVSCPSCREEFTLPEGGVKNLRSNFFVTKIKERKSIRQKLQQGDAEIPCTSCSANTTPGVAVARCVECNDFLCDKCVEVHKSVRVLEKHQLLTLEELRSGKLAIHNLPEQETCAKHKGEVLWFYCETCDMPMCRNCSVVDHPRPEHKQVDLESTAKQRIQALLELSQKCEPVAKMITSAIETDTQIKDDLDAAFNNALAIITRTTDSAIASLKKKGAAKESELRQLKARRDKEIEYHLDHLSIMRIRVQTAMDMSRQITDKGSDHDVATMYASLATNIEQVCHDQPLPIRKSIAKVAFIPNNDLATHIANRDELGVLKGCNQWTLEKSVACLTTTPRSITFNCEGNIVVTDHYKTSHSVKVFDFRTEECLLSMNTQRISRSEPWGVAPGVVAGQSGNYFVTDLSPHVKMFDSEGIYVRRFGTMQLQDKEFKSNLATQLYGIAIGDNGHIYVGSSDHYISIHDEIGTHISSFETASFPYYIAVSPANEIFVSDHKSHDLAIHVYDTAGNLLRQLEKPEGEASWYPTGLSCSASNEIFVACSNPAAIFLYSTSGRCLDVVTKEMKEPWDVAVSKDGETLAVIDKQGVKMFHLE